MRHKKLIKGVLVFFIIGAFITIFNVSADEQENSSDSTQRATVTIRIPQASIRIYNVSNFDDLQWKLGIPYYQIIAKALKAEDARDIKWVYFYYPGPLTETGASAFSNADIKSMIILDKSKEINNDSVKEMRDQIFSEVIRYQRFLHDKKQKEYLFRERKIETERKEFFLNEVKIFSLDNPYYRRVAMWIEEGKLIYCSSNFPLKGFLEKYVGNISNALKEYKIKEYKPSELNEAARKRRRKDLEYNKGFLETLKQE